MYSVKSLKQYSPDMVQMFFVSPRNSVEAQLSLLEESGASKILTTSQEPPYVTAILKKREIQKFAVPELDQLLDSKPVEHIPFTKSFKEYRMQPWVLLHTSGSTGTPKVVTIRHGYATTVDGQFLAPEGYDVALYSANQRVFNPFPPFHMAGLMWSLPVVVFIESTIVLPPPQPITAEIANSIHEMKAVDWSMLPPSIIVDLVKNEAAVENLRHLKGLRYAGGPLPKATGDLLAGFVTLLSSLGSTEALAMPQLPRPNEHWAYFKFNERFGGLEFREADDGLFEMVIVRREGSELAQAIFVTFPDIEEYPTKDLFAPHPTEPHLWKYAGRRDDIIVFSNGEKFNPVTMEGTVTASPEVNGALVVGQGKFHAGMLIEPKTHPTTEEQEAKLVDTIWPSVDRANKAAVKQGRVPKDFIALTDPEKPLPRSGKNTIQRARANNVYAAEVEAMFGDTREENKEKKPRLDLRDFESTSHSLQTYFVEELGVPEVNPEVDFAMLGVDSLQLTTLLRALNGALNGRQLEAKELYDNSSIDKLAQFLHADADDYDFSEDGEEEDAKDWQEMQHIYDQFSSNLPGHNERSRVDRILHSSEYRPVIATHNGNLQAWLQVLASFLININNWGLVYSFGVFQDFYETNYLVNHSVSSIAWIGTLQSALLLIIGVISGPLFDKGWLKPVLVTASILLVLAVMLLSLCTQYYQIMLAQGVLAGIASGLLYIPSVAVIPQYFTARGRRGLALGLGTSGGSIGGIIYPVVFRRLLSDLGFPWATRIMGFIMLGTLVAAIFLTRSTGQATKLPRQLIDPKALREVPFVAFMTASCLIFIGILVPFFLAPAFSTSVGASTNTAFYLVAVINTAQFFGRVIPSFLADYIGPEIMLSAAQFSAAVCAFAWIAVHNVPGFTALLIIYGFLSGLLATLPAVVTPFVCPSMAVYGTRLGMVYAMAGVGSLIGVPVAVYAQAGSGKWLGPQLWAGFTLLAGAGFFVVTCVKARRRRVVYDRAVKRQEHRNAERKRLAHGKVDRSAAQMASTDVLQNNRASPQQPRMSRRRSRSHEKPAPPSDAAARHSNTVHDDDVSEVSKVSDSPGSGEGGQYLNMQFSDMSRLSLGSILQDISPVSPVHS